MQIKTSNNPRVNKYLLMDDEIGTDNLKISNKSADLY